MLAKKQKNGWAKNMAKNMAGKIFWFKLHKKVFQKESL